MTDSQNGKVGGLSKDQTDHDALVDRAIAAIERLKGESRLPRASRIMGLRILREKIDLCLRATRADL